MKQVALLLALALGVALVSANTDDTQVENVVTGASEPGVIDVDKMGDYALKLDKAHERVFEEVVEPQAKADALKDVLRQIRPLENAFEGTKTAARTDLDNLNGGDADTSSRVAARAEALTVSTSADTLVKGAELQAESMYKEAKDYTEKALKGEERIIKEGTEDEKNAVSLLRGN